MKKFPLHIQIIAGILLGLAFGVLAINTGLAGFTSDFIKPFGTIFVNLLKMVAVPMIVTSLIVGVTSLKDVSKLSRMGGKAIGIFVGTTICAITIGVILANIFRPGDGIPPETKAKLMASYSDAAEKNSQNAAIISNQSPLKPLIDLFPENLIKAASDNGNMLQVVIVAIFFGVALILIPEEKAKPVIKLLDGLNDAVLKLVDMIMYLAPIGVFALIASVVTDVAGDNPNEVFGLLAGLGKYVAIVLIGLILHILLVYMPMIKIWAKRSPLWFLKNMRPVQLLGFSTSSSNATLALNIENAEKNLGIDEEVSGFVLPLGATINMDGTSMYQAIAAIFIAQALNIPLTLGDQLMVILTATLASIGSAGVPGAGMVMLVIVLNSIGVPAAGIALIMGPDRILDMCRTIVNVTGDATIATVVAKTEGLLREPKEA